MSVSKSSHALLFTLWDVSPSLLTGSLSFTSPSPVSHFHRPPPPMTANPSPPHRRRCHLRRCYRHPQKSRTNNTSKNPTVLSLLLSTPTETVKDLLWELRVGGSECVCVRLCIFPLVSLHTLCCALCLSVCVCGGGGYVWLCLCRGTVDCACMRECM